jgi:hypothetical protein
MNKKMDTFANVSTDDQLQNPRSGLGFEKILTATGLAAG